MTLYCLLAWYFIKSRGFHSHKPGFRRSWKTMENEKLKSMPGKVMGNKNLAKNHGKESHFYWGRKPDKHGCYHPAVFRGICSSYGNTVTMLIWFIFILRIKQTPPWVCTWMYALLISRAVRPCLIYANIRWPSWYFLLINYKVPGFCEWCLKSIAFT